MTHSPTYRIKPLVWENNFDDGSYIAPIPFGYYYIVRNEDGEIYVRNDHEDFYLDERVASVDGGFSIAEAHYIERIKSCLEEV